MDNNYNRVYVNPNFNRMPNRTSHTLDPKYTNNHLYVNPNFTRNTTDMQQFNNLNRKIYVNPNFIKTTNAVDRNPFSSSVFKVGTTESLEVSNSTINRYSDTMLCKTEKSSETISLRPSSKSRYCLVRKNDRVLEGQRQVKESCTIKINKYKSIPLHNFKNNLQIVKNDSAKHISSSKMNTNALKPEYVNRNYFKLVKHNIKPIINTSFRLTPKSLKIKRNIDLKAQLKLKVLNGARKKNNIPCRLFTKYGKCLRNLYGTCEFLHDKKHVSLCRKFIKGVCHDKQCLLSHELSSKKMPTCYFYLKGMCTKDDCPYLHVKLSEKTKICHDFLKGYCDKGLMCLHRHVRLQTDKKKDNQLYTLNKHAFRPNKLNNSKSIQNNELRKLQGSKDIPPDLVNHVIGPDKDGGDCRYFKDLRSKDAMCEVLKPTRCKLGALPSFIRL